MSALPAHPYTYTFDESGVLHRTHVETGTVEHDDGGFWSRGRYVSRARERAVNIGPFTFAEDALAELTHRHDQLRQVARREAVVG
jgi:hypothetical protein